MGFVNTELDDIVEMKEVNHTYDNGESYVIQDFNLLIEDKPEQGQFVVILGPSGCGKSTILRYIAGLQKPTSGEILLHHKPLPKDPNIGMVFQQYSSFPWYTVLQNVMLPLLEKGVEKNDAKEQAMEWIKKVELEGHENKYAVYPKLSGGQLQRVAIARSFISSPEILLLDEPLGALDISTRYNMQLLIARLWEETKNTMIMVTHDIPEAVFLGDDIYIMSSAPSLIVDHTYVDLPFNRTKEVKQSQKFFELVNEVEFKLENAKYYHD